MRRAFRWMGFLLVCSSAIANAADPQPPKPAPTSYGEAIEALSSENDARRAAAVEMLDDVDLLLLRLSIFSEIYSDEESEEDTARYEALLAAALPRRLLLLDALDSRDDAVVNVAAMALAGLGDGAAPVVPKLRQIAIEERRSPEVRALVLTILVALAPREQPVGPLMMRFAASLPEGGPGFESLPWLAPTMDGVALPWESFDELRGLGAIIAWHLIGCDRTIVELPYVFKLTEAEHPLSIRVMMIHALGQLGEESDEVVPHLESLFKDEEPLIRAASARSLCWIHNEEAEIPRLVAAARLKPRAARTLRKGLKEGFDLSALGRWLCGWSSAESNEKETDEMADFIRRAHGPKKRWWIHGGMDFVPLPQRLIPLLEELSEDPDELTRRSAAKALRRIRPAAEMP